MSRARLGRFFDRVVLWAALFFALFFFFAVRTRHLLWALAMALAVAGLLVYARRLWRDRGRAESRRAKTERARYHLHNLMLAPYDQARETALRLVAERWGIQDLQDCAGRYRGEEVRLVFIQRPLEDRLPAAYVLEVYHATRAPRLLLLATCSFAAEAAVFARQLRSPKVALVGGEDLLPLMEHMEAEPDAPREDAAVRKRAVWKEAIHRACDPARAKRYLGYGVLMLLVYILLGYWAFLPPGLLCVLLAVAARHQNLRQTTLFGE